MCIKLLHKLLNMYYEIYQRLILHSCFSQSHKIGNAGIIANFVFPYICNFRLYLQQMMSVNVKLEIKGYISITF